MAEINTEELSTIKSNIAVFKNVGVLEDTGKKLKVQSNSDKSFGTSTFNLKVPESMRRVTTKRNDIKGHLCTATLIILVVAFMQIPNVLYYTKPSLKETTLLNVFNLESCSVRDHELVIAIHTANICSYVFKLLRI